MYLMKYGYMDHLSTGSGAHGTKSAPPDLSRRRQGVDHGLPEVRGHQRHRQDGRDDPQDDEHAQVRSQGLCREEPDH